MGRGDLMLVEVMDRRFWEGLHFYGGFGGVEVGRKPP